MGAPLKTQSTQQSYPPTRGPFHYKMNNAPTQARKHAHQFPHNPNIHVDGGANHSITNNITILHQFKQNKNYAMNDINSDSPALYCTGQGLLPWKAPNGKTLFINCYYSADAGDKIISPTDVVIMKLTDFNAWTQLQHRYGSGIHQIPPQRKSRTTYIPPLCNKWLMVHRHPQTHHQRLHSKTRKTNHTIPQPISDL
jgi:hypothetical protein